MARLPQGAGGFDMNAMMKQVQQMQAEMTEAQEKLKDEVVEASAGGGMVKVKMSGDLRLLSLEIDPDAVDPEDAEMLQDMVLAAVNEAIRAAQELAASKMGGVAGLGGGGGLGGPRPAGDVGARVYPEPINKLVGELSKLPGIGQRTAQRLAFHILRSRTATPPRSPRRSARSRSGSGSARSASTSPRARAARSAKTPAATAAMICVVEQPADVIPIERTHEYRGLYHVLGGALSPIDGIDPEDLKIAELVERVRGGEVSEVVLATNPTTTGEATAHHLAELLARRRLDHPPRQRPAGRRRSRARRRGHARPRLRRPPGRRLTTRHRLSLRAFRGGRRRPSAWRAIADWIRPSTTPAMPTMIRIRPTISRSTSLTWSLMA